MRLAFEQNSCLTECHIWNTSGFARDCVFLLTELAKGHRGRKRVMRIASTRATCRKIRRASRRRSGFTLMELLVVISIIILLMTLLMPSMRGAMARARQAQCANQLKQISVVCITFARDNKGQLPKGNAVNPTTFRQSLVPALNNYMNAAGVTPEIWYCPTLDDPNATIADWMRFVSGRPIIMTDEFRIGYFYIGGLTTADNTKFRKNFDARSLSAPEQELVFDICATWDISPQNAVDVPPGAWNDFPHANRMEPRSQNVLRMDGSVEQRTLDRMTLGYVYIHPRRVYW